MALTSAQAFLGGAGISAGSSIISSLIGARQTDKWNRKQYEQTERWNQINLDYAKNAQTYAVADRMRAGLSPLDVQPQSAPSSNLASPQQADFSGIGAAGQSIQNGLQAALRYNLDKQGVDAQVELNNALKTKAESEAVKTKADTLAMIGKYKTDLELQQAELERVKNVNATYKKEVEARLAETYKRIADLESQINQRDVLTPSLVSLNDSSAGRNNAEAEAIQNDLTFANTFGIPYTMVKNLNFNSPFSSMAADTFLSASMMKERVNASAIAEATDTQSLKDAYQYYADSYDAALKQLNDEMNDGFMSGKPREFFEDIAERRKELGKKLSFKEFVRIRNKSLKSKR